MATFEIATDVVTPLPKRLILHENVEKDKMTLASFLDSGVYLSSVTAAVTETDVDSTVSGAELTADKKGCFWLITAADDPESFTLVVTLTTNDSQTLNYTIPYSVV